MSIDHHATFTSPVLDQGWVELVLPVGAADGKGADGGMDGGPDVGAAGGADGFGFDELAGADQVSFCEPVSKIQPVHSVERSRRLLDIPRVENAGGPVASGLPYEPAQHREQKGKRDPGGGEGSGLFDGRLGRHGFLLVYFGGINNRRIGGRGAMDSAGGAEAVRSARGGMKRSNAL